ncbi:MULTISPECIES: WGxxGxxG family protein [unclassified Luteococcus]|uniref:WGxxGxxG family protein n=1 Tax=unclassified Luteococcus TaxID=2639923 RepID=UPI00313F1896
MRKTLAASALGTVILLGGPAVAQAETTSPTPAPVGTSSAAPVEHTTKTVEKKDRTGLWGLLGLAGLAGLAGLKKKPEQHTTVRPAHVETREPQRTSTLRQDTDVRTGNLRSDVRDGDLNRDGRRDV